MNIFALYTTVKITDEPNWLNEFRRRYDLEFNPNTGQYDNPRDMHITLTQPRFISDSDAQILNVELAKLFNKINPVKFNVEFSNWHLDRQDATDSGCIMIKSNEYNKLFELQQQLLEIIGNNNNYIEPKFQAYEKDFIPHLTIGRDLSKERYDSAISELPKNVSIKAIIDNVILVVVQDKSPDERNNSKNLSVFKLH